MLYSSCLGLISYCGVMFVPSYLVPPVRNFLKASLYLYFAERTRLCKECHIYNSCAWFELKLVTWFELEGGGPGVNLTLCCFVV